MPEAHNFDFQIGVGFGVHHFGEVLQGYFHDLPDATDRASLTLPLLSESDAANFFRFKDLDFFDHFKLGHSGCKVTFTPEPDSTGIMVHPCDKKLCLIAANKTFQKFNFDNIGGKLEVESKVPTARGLGSSTADVQATVEAVLRSISVKLDFNEIARLVVEVEGASDAVMFDKANLFITTKGIPLEQYNCDWPNLIIIGGDTDHESAGIVTNEIPQRFYTKEESNLLEELRDKVRIAFSFGDTGVIGEVATKSASLNQRFLYKSQFTDFVSVSKSYGAVGVVAAHSGTMLGALFDPARELGAGMVEMLLQDLRKIGMGNCQLFCSGKV